jgi:hypothetical protein
MANGNIAEGLRLTEEEAFALLGLCLTSPNGLDAVSEKALRKLADYCTKSNSHSFAPTNFHLTRELGNAGA